MESTRKMLLVPRWSCQSREVARHGHTNWVDPSNPLAVGCAHVVAGGAAVDLLNSIPFICLLKEANQHKMFAQVYAFKFQFLKSDECGIESTDLRGTLEQLSGTDVDVELSIDSLDDVVA